MTTRTEDTLKLSIDQLQTLRETPATPWVERSSLELDQGEWRVRAVVVVGVGVVRLEAIGGPVGRVRAVEAYGAISGSSRYNNTP